MRRITPFFIVLVALFAGGSANARPSGPCAITILRAPPDVRATVEAWVDRETSCRVALEVRIVPTDGGLYLFARDERERIYERIVPDAQSAGVLVASWMADDTMAGAAPVEEPVTESAPEPTMSESLAVDEMPRRAEPAQRSQWLMVAGMHGATINGDTLNGVRADVDVLRAGTWNLGLSASIASGGIGMEVVSRDLTVTHTLQPTSDIKALIYAVRQIELGDWHVRPSFGLGALISTTQTFDPNWLNNTMPQTFKVSSTMAELSFVVSRDLGAQWAMHGGFALDLTPQRFELSPNPADGMVSAERTVDLVLLFGLGHRL